VTTFEKYTVWGSTAAVTVTGVAFAWMKYLLKPADEFAVVNHPLQPLMLKLHIAAAPVMVFGLGMIVMRHIWPHFRRGVAQGRKSGLTSMLLVLPMIVSGYALQTLSAQSWLRWLGYIHLGLGLVFATAALLHGLATRVRGRVRRGWSSRPRRAATAAGAQPAASRRR